MSTKELLNKLPKSWDEITLEQFQSLSTTSIDLEGDLLSGVENSLSVISKLTGASVNELEELSMFDISLLSNRLLFMSVEPKPNKKSILIFKKLEDITYNDFIVFTQIQENSLDNLHIFIKTFTKTELSEGEILLLPITEVLTGFFLFKKKLQKSLRRSMILTTTKLIIQLIKIKLVNLKKIIWK